MNQLPRNRRHRGFTLVELMVVVAILGTLAALAVPGLVGYIRRAKTTEAYANLSNLYRSAASYYKQQFSDSRSVSGETVGYCTVASTTTGWIPSDQKQFRDWEAEPNFRSLRFTIADPVYYVYEIESVQATCRNDARQSTVYTFRALGDLDNDSEFSTFELSVGASTDNDLVRSSAFYVEAETE